VHGGLPTLQEELKLQKQSHGNPDMMQRKIRVAKVADGHHVRLPLGWMDGRTWYQLATLLSRSYCMVSSHVSRTKHVKGDGMCIPREVIWGT
jgi:hypothetical protein